jgi:hypothetical protein
MPTTQETDDMTVTEADVTSFEIAQHVSTEPPRELLQYVASNLKSLARVLPYPEYAAIVRRIAEVRWRCELATASSAAASSRSELPNAVRNA